MSYRVQLRSPLQLKAIALFQFLKGAILLLAPVLLYACPTALTDSPRLAHILFLAARGRNLPGLVMPLAGLYLLLIGFGLWTRNPWARRSVLLGSLITIFLCMVRLGLFDSFFGYLVLPDSPGRQTIFIVILLDTAVFLYLALHPDVKESFTRNA